MVPKASVFSLWKLKKKKKNNYETGIESEGRRFVVQLKTKVSAIFHGSH